MRRTLGVTAVGVVVLLVLGLGAGGWYYTDELLPAPQPEDPAYDVAVVASDEAAGTVTLAADDEDLLELERLGFWTAAGTLELGEVTATAADTVTRTATLLDGDWPEVGDSGAATATTFRGDPMDAVGLEFTDVVVAGPDGDLPAWFVPGDGADGAADDGVDGAADDEADAAAGDDRDAVAVMVHGRGATREELHRTLRTVHEVGLDALVISVRNDPGAPADPDGWGRFGDTEWEDLQAAVDHVVEDRDAQRLVLVGSSQGGSLVLGWLRRGEHTDRAVAAVLASPLVSMHDTLVLQAQGRDIPDAVIPPLLWSTKLLATLRSGMRFHRLEHAADGVVDTYEVPMLVTHGTDDSTVPVSGSRALAEARPDLVQLELYEDAEHVREWNHDPERYDDDLRAFLTAALG